MIVREEKEGTTLTVAPEGRMDTLSSPELEQFLRDRYDGARQIVLDLAKVEYISSAGLRLIIQAHKAMKDKDGLLLRSVPQQVMDVLKTTGYTHVVKIV